MADLIKAEVEALYRAGKELIPEKAQIVADTAGTLSDSLGAWQGQAFGAGNPHSLTVAMAMNEELYTLMRRAVQLLNDMSIALVAVADRFIHTDDQAAAAAQQLQALVQEPLTTVEVPPAHPVDES